MFLTLRFAAALLAVAVTPLIFPEAPITVLVAGCVLVLGLAFWDVVTAPRPSAMVTARRAPAVARVEGTHDVVLELRVPDGRRAGVAVRDGAAPSLRVEPSIVSAVLPPGVARLRYRIRPRRRGRFVLGPAAIRTYGRLGLAGRQGTAGTESPMKVYPELRGRAHVESLLARVRVLDAGIRSTNARGGGQEFDSLRDYHRDDEFRAINWAATSRAGKPISNVYREDRNQQLLLMLDAGRTMAGMVGGSPRFEHALDAAVAICSLAVGIGDRVGAFAFADGIRVSIRPDAGSAQVARLVDALFAVEPEVEASDYRGALSVVLGRYRRRAMVVLFTDLADEGALDTLLSVVPSLVRRHLVVVAQIADPEVARLARLMPQNAEEAFLKAAAASAAVRRSSGVRRLAHLGATVVDQPPGRLAPALADAYLRIKSLGRL